jgi:hypothetical protein
MRMTVKPPRCDGDRRVRKGFLWLPKTIENQRRWLERAKWVEEYDMVHWVPVCWVDR